MKIGAPFSLLFACTLVFDVLGGRVQKSYLRLPRGSRRHRDDVQKMFLESYQAYKYVLSLDRD